MAQYSLLEKFADGIAHTSVISVSTRTYKTPTAQGEGFLELSTKKQVYYVV